MKLRYYAPRGTDAQTPHDQDELYVVASGRGTFVVGGQRVPVRPRGRAFRRRARRASLRGLLRGLRDLGRVLRPAGRRARLSRAPAPGAGARGPLDPGEDQTRSADRGHHLPDAEVRPRAPERARGCFLDAKYPRRRREGGVVRPDARIGVRQVEELVGLGLSEREDWRRRRRDGCVEEGASRRGALYFCTCVGITRVTRTTW